MPLYFAYGANMDAAGMAARCPRSRPLGRARLARWRFIVMPSGFASIAPDPRGAVHGVLWEISPADMPALDRFEDVRGGLYRKTTLPALREPCGYAQALVYVGNAERKGAAWPGYLEGVAAAAQAQSLPMAYIKYLEALLDSKGPRS